MAIDELSKALEEDRKKLADSAANEGPEDGFFGLEPETDNDIELEMASENMADNAVPSGYLPGTSIRYAWDSTTIGALKTCPRLYYLSIIEGWQPKNENIHLRFGIECHTALQSYDIRRALGDNHDDALASVVSDMIQRIEDWDPDRDTKAGNYKNPNTLLQLVIDWIDHYKDDPAKTYLRQDGTPAVELSFRFELGLGPAAAPDQPYIICGHLDRVVEFNGQLMIVDHKTTTTTLSQYYFDQYEPHNQMTLYTLAGKIVLDAPIRGVIIDAAQIKLSDPNTFQRGFTYRTQDQLDEWAESLIVYLDQAESYAISGVWPMNDSSCDKYGGCKFREICSLGLGVRERFLKASFTQQSPDQRWNPLIVR
jgi:hypothetical protein